MNWKLQPEESNDTVRVYRNTTTGEMVTMDLLITDKGGRKWWGFRDLFTLPFMRVEMSKSLAQFFQAGITMQDLRDMFREMKALIKPLNGVRDPEHYEKLYAAVLQRENILDTVGDPNVQYLSMATIYCCADRENIELFSHEHVAEKLKIWQNDDELTAFFLSWHAKRIAAYMTDLGKISQIVSKVAQPNS